MEDHKMYSELIGMMVKTPGWEIVKTWIGSKIESSKVRLLTVDPTDVKKIVEYQTTIRNYDGLLSQINSYIKNK
jgi:hypothetical protein